MKRLYKDNCYVSNNARIEAGLPTFASMTSGTPPRATWCRTGSPYTSWGKSLATRVLRQASAALISVGKACSSRPMRMLSPQGSTSKSRRLIVPPLRPDHLNQVRLGGRWAGFGTDLTKPLTHRRGQSGGQDRVGRPWVLSRPGRKIRTKALGFLKISKCLSHLVHISPWAATLGLFAGAARLLGPGAPRSFTAPISKPLLRPPTVILLSTPACAAAIPPGGCAKWRRSSMRRRGTGFVLPSGARCRRTI